MNVKLPSFIIILFCIVSNLQTVRAETMQNKFVDVFEGGLISGKLLKSNGRPLPYTELELVPLGEKIKSQDMRLWAITDMRGNFAFKNVPEGSYTLSINFNEKPIDTSPYSTVYYPKTSERSEAKVFEIIDGSRFNRLSFRLPPKLLKRTITGKVTWKDGTPVKNAYITILDIEVDTLLDFRVQTDAEGFFSTKAFIGRKYSIVAMLLDSPKIDAYSEPIARGLSEPFVFDANTKPIEIVIEKLNQPKSNKPKDDGTIGSLSLKNYKT